MLTFIDWQVSEGWITMTSPFDPFLWVAFPGYLSCGSVTRKGFPSWLFCFLLLKHLCLGCKLMNDDTLKNCTYFFSPGLTTYLFISLSWKMFISKGKCLKKWFITENGVGWNFKRSFVLSPIFCTEIRLTNHKSSWQRFA